MGYKICKMPFKHKAPGVSIRLPDFGLGCEVGAPADQQGMWHSGYLCMWRRKAFSAIDANQSCLSQGHIEFQMHRMVYEHLRSPESARRNLLRSPSPHVDFSGVYETVLWKETTGLSYQDTGKGRQKQQLATSETRDRSPWTAGLPCASHFYYVPPPAPPPLPTEEEECPELFFSSDAQTVLLKICILPKQYGSSSRAICILHNFTAC